MKNINKKVKQTADKQDKSQPDSALNINVVHAAFRRRPVNFIYLAGFLAIMILGINLGVLFLISDQQLRTIFSDVISPVVDLSVGVTLFIAAKYSAARSKQLAIAWGTIALAMLLYTLGDIAWIILEVGLKVQPFPSIADGFYLAFYPVALIGVFLLLDKPATTGELIKRALDMGIVMVAAIIGFWNFLIGPIIKSNVGQPLLAQDILLAYPVGDLVLFAALLLLFYNRSEKQDNKPIFFLAGGFLVTIIADSIYSYQSLLGIYVSGDPLDLSWVVSSLLIGLAGIYQLVALRSTSITEKKPVPYGVLNRLKAFGTYLPYLWLLIVFASLWLHEVGATSPSIGSLPLFFGVAGIVVLVLVRQIIALSENDKLNTRLRMSMDRIQVQAAELEKTNQELRIDITGRKQAEAARQESEALFQTLFELSPDAIVLIDPHDPSEVWPIIDCNMAACQMNGYTRDELIGRPIDTINLTPFTLPEKSIYLKQLREAGILRYMAQHRRKDGTIFPVDIATTLIIVGGRELIAGIDHDITERKRAEKEIKRRLAELEAVNQISTALRLAQTLDVMLPLLLDATLDVMHASRGAIWLYDPVRNELRTAAVRGWGLETGAPPTHIEKPGEGINGFAFATSRPYFASDFHLDLRLPESERQWIPSGMGGAVVPILAGQNVIGTLDVNVSLPRELTPDEIHLLTTLSEIAGNAIQRTMLHQQTERRLKQVAALSNVDRAISSTLDLRLSLGVLLEYVIAQLGVDATDVLLFNPDLHTLGFSAGRGFRTKAFEQARLRLGEGYAGKVVLKRESVYIPDLVVQHDNPRLEKHLADEQFVSYYGVPLIAKGQVKGVLEIFQRAPLEPDKEWLDFLGSLAGQAAIAIDSVMQFDNLQSSNSELSQAYDETIEGWSHALDLRDKETEGHTQRVTEMTVSLAREAGLDETELVQVRWGSLLHDIGKMGVPDGILLKPGPLTDEEWVIMKKHPIFAYEMISPIRYLRSALDIPYCHHEKWDGTGYPRGLKGEQIPLTARIFAIVDEWDALCSDRPYRSAWPEEKVRDHIQAGAGTHFDPQVVKAFLGSEVFLSRNRE